MASSSYRLGRKLKAGYRGLLDFVTYLQTTKHFIPPHPIIPDPLPDPAPPNAQSVLVEEVDGLESLTIPFTSSVGNVIVGIAARNNAADNVDIVVTWQGDELTMVDNVFGGNIGDPYVAFFYIKEGATGSGDIVVTAEEGSVGYGAVQINDCSVMGSIRDNDSFFGSQYYYEGYMPALPHGAYVLMIGVSITGAAFPFTPDSESDTVYWSTGIEAAGELPGMAAAFITSQYVSHGYYLMYPNGTQFGAFVAIAFDELTIIEPE